MTREEKIQEAAKIFYASSDDYTVYKKGFEAGAIYADQHPRKGLWDSKKVTEWLEEHVREFKYYDSDFADGNFDVDGLIETLTKAMED